MQAKDKLLVIGPHRAGKTTLVHTLSETEPLPDPLTRPDFGQVTAADGRVLYLLGAPGQLGLHLTLQALADTLLGAIVVVDSADPSSFPQAAQMVALVAPQVRCVVAATKQDLPDAASLDTLQAALNLGAIPVIPCVASDLEQAQQVLTVLLLL